MTEIVLFHHAQGLTPGLVAFADELRAASHTVHAPDLFEGRIFATLEEGIAYAKTVGFDTILDRGVAEAGALRPDLVYAGLSLGVMPVQKLAQTRAGARGALLIDACFPVTEFGDRWPDGEQAELFLDSGDVHLFADASLPSYDQAATELMTGRVLDFLSTLGGA